MPIVVDKGKYGKLTVERRSVDGELECRVSYTFQHDKDFARAAREVDVGEADLRRAVDRCQRDGGAQAVAEAEAAAGEPVTLRGRTQPVSCGRVFSAGLVGMREALAVLDWPAPEPVLSWQGTEVMACADVDFHASAPPAPARLEAIAELVRPRPAAYWVTHGGGLRLVYEGKGGFDAGELAAVACLAVRAQDPLAGLEVKCSTRHPAYPTTDGRTCGTVHWLTQDADVDGLRAWLGRREANDDAVQEWLAERGLELSRRYSHDCCPVEPHVAAGREPVSVRDGGVFCHACNGRGITLGHRVAGWFPYSALCGHGVSSTLRMCIDGLAHWEHAQHVLSESVGLQGAVGRLAYSAALRLRHGVEDIRVPAVFAAGRNFVRFERRWGTMLGETYTKDVRPILARLPACQWVGEDSKPAIDLERVARFDNPVDLTGYGYPALDPVWGVRIYGHNLPQRDSNKVPVVLQPRSLAHPSMESFRARYVPRDARDLSEEESWRIMEELFPGVCRPAVRLLIAAKGCAEGEIGMPPMIFISGPTGSAKSSTVVLAAAICGDTNHSVVWSSNLERVRGSLLEAKESGSFVTFNEMLKDGKNAGQSLLGTMDFLLNLTPDSLSHKLYVGPVPLGGLPVCVWTDTQVPFELKQEAQLARRLTHVHLPSRVDWSSTLRSSGLGQVENVRTADLRYASACDVILSQVIDDFFSVPMTFEEVACELGFATLANSREADEGVQLLKAFFTTVCDAPELTGSDAVRWKGRGWKSIRRDVETPLSELWAQLADEDYGSSRRCGEVDWAQVCGLKHPATFETRSHGSNHTVVRFVYHLTRTNYKVNNELLELGSEVRGLRVHGHGDAVSGQPDPGWATGLSQAPDYPPT